LRCLSAKSRSFEFGARVDGGVGEDVGRGGEENESLEIMKMVCRECQAS